MTSAFSTASTDDGRLRIELVYPPALYYALVHNHVPTVHHLRVTALAEEARQAGEPTLDLTVTVQLTGPDGPLTPPWTRRIAGLPAGQQVGWDEFDGLNPAVSAFKQANEAFPIEYVVTVATQDGPELRLAAASRVLAHNEWFNSPTLYDSIAAFVQPNTRAVSQVLRAAGDILARTTDSSSIEGYQAGALRATQIGSALYEALRARHIVYATSASFEDSGQKVRTTAEVLRDRLGNCIDLSVTFAACLEAAGLHPLIWMIEGHAFAGFFISEERLAQIVSTDPAHMINLVESGRAVAVELTAIGPGSGSAGFAEAALLGKTALRDGRQLLGLIDIRLAHRSEIRPLPSTEPVEQSLAEEHQAADDAPVRQLSLPADLERLGVFEQEKNLELEAADDGAPPRIAAWRRSLLDLSLRNPLLKLPKRGKGLTLHVPAGSLSVLDDLVHDNKAIRVIPQDPIGGVHALQGIRRAQDLPDEVVAEELARDHRIYAEVTEAAYVQRMRGLQRDARTLEQETGSNYLYLTLGSLVHPTPTGEAHAPLFLLPVRIDGGTGRRPYTVLIDGDELAAPNYCLVQWLQVKHGVRIGELERPSIDERGIDINAAFGAIRRGLVDNNLPYRIDESASLRLLQFSTFQMWRDLSRHWEPFMENEVVRHLVEKAGTPLVDGSPDVVVDEASMFLPIAADGSQMRAIEMAEKGHSFVLEGPPGTGKSQTITNLIAHTIRSGRTVLFVAEKQAALDVVKRRLAKVGLEHFCLDLHGRKQTQRSIWQQLKAAHEHGTTADDPGWEALESRHRSRIATLGHYPGQLHTVNDHGFSVWKAYQGLLAHGDGPCAAIPEAYFTASQEQRAAVEHAARELPSVAQSAQVRANHPWRISGRRDVRDLSADELLSVAQGMEQTRDFFCRLPESLRAVIARLPAPWMVADVLPVARLAAEGQLPSVEHTVEAMRPGWDQQVHALHQAVTALHGEHGQTLASFHPDLFLASEVDELTGLADAAEKGLIGKKGRREALALALRRYLLAPTPLDEGNVLTTFGRVLSARQHAATVAGHAQHLRGLLPRGWWPTVAHAASAIETAHRAVMTSRALYSRLPDLWSELAGLGRGVPASELTRMADVWRRWLMLLHTTDAEFASWAAGTGWAAAWNRDGARWRDDLVNGPRPVQRWGALLSSTDILAEAGLMQLRDQVINGAIPPDEIHTAFLRGRARSALAERLRAGDLEHFDAAVHEHSVSNYLAVGHEMRRQLPRRLAADLIAGRSNSVKRFDARAGELIRRLNSRRDRLPFRDACAELPDVVAALTPCFLMSPVSVANFLKPGGLTFDLVVFDEASQIRVAQAIGAMGRARSVVVVGDSKQMPPSSVMQAANTDDTDDSAVPDDLDSILTECVESGLPREWLTWHYRSTDESLIAFSNSHYYESKLASLPSPGGDDTTGISWRRVDGQFDRGTRASRTNPVEAQAVVDEIARLLTDPRTAGRSVGVVTFNVQQRDLLLNLLEDSQDEHLQNALNRQDGEALFVKNLENVQGDERDVILFSLAFSPNPDTGQLPLNFGPLSLEGGERRLNVAVTRARMRVILFSSFDPSHIDLSRTKAVGTRHLRAYLELAAKGLRTSGDATGRLAQDPDRMTAEVANALRGRGLDVATDFGLSHFTVDLAVRAVGALRWQVAVLLDGPGWAGRPTVADRDAAPALLESIMRWSHVVRVWLPQWINDRDQVLKRIEDAVVAASYAPAPEPTVATAAESVCDVMTSVAPVPIGPARPVMPTMSVATALPAPQPSETAGTVPFVPYRPETVGTREQINDLARNRPVQQLVRDRLEQVIAAEGPIEMERLLRLVHNEFGLQKVHTDRKELMTGFVPKDHQVTRGHDARFVWPLHLDPDTWRGVRQNQASTDRMFDEIAREEIANAMSWAFDNGRAHDTEQLFRTAMELLGFRRKSQAMDDTFHRVLAWGVLNGRLPNRLSGFEVSTSVNSQLGPVARRNEAAAGRAPVTSAVSTTGSETNVEAEFEQAMRSVYDRAKDEVGYNATYFLSMLAELGGLATAKKLINAPEISDGFAKLWERGRLDLTVEAVVIQPRFAELFTDEDIAAACRRLEQFDHR